MASAYLRTIEFKVKDQALKRSVDKLGKSLGSIVKSVDAINKQFGRLSTSIKGLGKELQGVVKSTKTLNQNSKNIEIVNPKKITASLLKLKQVKAVIRDLNKVGSAFGTNRRLSDEYNDAAATLKDFIREVANGTKYIAANEQGLNRQAAAFAKVAAASKINSAQYKNAIMAQTKAEQNLRVSQLERIKVQETLYKIQDLRVSGKIRQGYDMTGFKGAKGMLELEDEIMMRDTIASLSAYKQELQNINRFLAIGSKEYKEIDAAVERISARLEETTVTKTKEVTKDKELTKQARERLRIQKANAKVLNQTVKTLGQIGRFSGRGLGELFGVLRGKRGSVPQLLAGDVSLEVIKNLIKFVPFLDQKLKKQIQTWSTYGQVAARVMTGIQIASGSLSAVLGGTQWVTSAVKGFIDFEKAAATSIWRIQNNWTKFQGVMGAALMFGFNPFGKGGAYDIAMGGANRRENKRYAQQGGTDLQINEKGLEKMNSLLLNRNRSAKDYQRILASAVQLEKEISRETKLQSVMRDHVSGKIARDMKKKDIESKKDLRYKRTKRREAFQERRDAFEFEQAEMRGRMYMGTEAQGLMAPGRQGRVRRDVWARYQSRLASRKQRRSMFNENMMLGACFPMLFGGGVGSVGGGIAGAAMNRSGKGFGAQILLSALGQQVDALVVKINELGKALRKPTENLSALVQAAGLTGTELEKQVKQLEALGLKASAAALVTDRLKQIVGQEGYKDLQRFSKEWEEFSNLISIATTRLMAFVSGPLSVLVDILGFFEETNRGKSAMRDATAAYNEKNKIPKWRSMIGNFLTGGTGMPLFRDKAGLKDWYKSYQASMNKKPGSQNEAIAAKLAQVQGADNKDLAAKVELERNRLNMTEKQFDIKSRQIEIARQGMEIEWQSIEYGKMKDGEEKKALGLKIRKLGLERQMAMAQLENIEVGTHLNDLYAQIGNTIENGIVSALDHAIQGTKSLGEVASSVFNSIARALLQFGVHSLLGAAFPNSKFFTRAEGGPVTGKNSYLVGERGPELFTPGSSGHITPNHELGGGGGNVTVNVDASGSAVEGDGAEASRLGKMLGAAIQAELIKQRRPGGLLR